MKSAYFLQKVLFIRKFVFMLFTNLCMVYQLSSSNFFWSSGTAKRGAVSGNRDVVGSETEASRSLTLDSSQGAFRKIPFPGALRSSAIMTSEHNRTSSGRNTSNIKNLETTLRGIESLHFNDERVHY